MTRAFVTGASGVLLTGINLHRSRQALKLVQHYPHCWSTVDAYPHDSDQWQSSTENEITVLANQSGVVAIGEYGLDFNHNFSTPQEQERVFETQLRVAAELQISIFMHCWDARERLLTLLEPQLDSLPGAVLHCFTETWQEMQDCMDRGFYISTTGWVCDERRGMELRELLPFILVERLLIEINAPYLLPRDLTPKPTPRRNESAHLPYVLERAAYWCGEDL